MEENIERTIDKTNMTEMIIREARRLGLEISADKTQAMIFRQKGRKRDKNRNIRIEGNRIELKNKIKYLGLLINDDWSFKEHLKNVAAKAERIMGKLCRLMANQRGPSEKRGNYIVIS